MTTWHRGATVLLDLTSYLQSQAREVLVLDEAMDARFELTALQHLLDAEGLYPIVLARRVRLADGSLSQIPVVNNLTASRALVASALGLQDHRAAAVWFARRSAAGIAPVVVESGAPVQEVVSRGEMADLTRLPALTQHEGEPGPYLTAAHATTFDPDTGIDNTAIQRCWLRASRRMSWYPYPDSHNAMNLRKHWERGQPCPVAFWIGHHPAVLMGTQSKLDYPQSHWEAAGGVIGQPLRLTPTVTHGRDVMVPADAEMVIEGFAQPGSVGPDGPFGEYTGYLGPQVTAPVVEVTCITRRREAIYHDYGSGLTDMLVPDNMAMEGKLFALAGAAAPSLTNVHVPACGRRFHAYLQLRGAVGSEARDALAAALTYRRVKMAIAVDEDVDIFSAQEMLWAMATRVQWSRDAWMLDGLPTSTLDPSLDEGARTGSKLAVDATRGRGPLAKEGASFAPRSSVPAGALRRAAELLGALGDNEWPRC